MKLRRRGDISFMVDGRLPGDRSEDSRARRAYAAPRISSKLDGRSNKFGWLQARGEESPSSNLHRMLDATRAMSIDNHPQSSVSFLFLTRKETSRGGCRPNR